MDYAAAQTAVMNFLQALGGHALNFFIALLSFAGAVFLIRWGMPIILNALNGDISYGEWKDIKDPEYFGKKYKNGKMRVRRKFTRDDNFDEYEFNGTKINPYL